MSARGKVRTYLLLSVAAGAMVLVVSIAGGDPAARPGGTARGTLGAALLLAAFLGSLSALRPNWTRGCLGRAPDHGGDAPDDPGEGLPGPPRRGHHPECETFGSHVVHLRGRPRCAGCTGLAVGSLCILPLVLLYVALPAALEPWGGPAMVLTGLSLVALDLGAAVAGSVGARAGLGLNALLVVGLALVSIGLLEATGELGWGLVGVLLCLLWVDARAQVSRWNHVAACAVCPDACVAYPP